MVTLVKDFGIFSALPFYGLNMGKCNATRQMHSEDILYHTTPGWLLSATVLLFLHYNFVFDLRKHKLRFIVSTFE